MDTGPAGAPGAGRPNDREMLDDLVDLVHTAGRFEAISVIMPGPLHQT